MRYSECYLGTFPMTPAGEKAYKEMLALKAEKNIGVIRKRFRGPRRKGVIGQSMCLKRDAVRFDAYIYGS